MKRVITAIAAFLSLIVSQANIADVGRDPNSPAAAVTGTNLKAGWSEAQISAFVHGCVAAVMIPAKRDYAARAAQAGHTGDDFPEAELRKSVEPMCSCLARRIAETWSFDEFMRNSQALSQPLLVEAMSGGRCKPEGILGEALAGHARKQ